MAGEQTKDLVKQSPISVVIQHFMPLQRKGTALLGLCPFHADSKPSMNVNDQRGIFKCFACGAGGDAISFVQRKMNMDYVEALKECARILGLPLDEFEKEKKKNPKLELGFRVLNAATKLYRRVGEQRPMNFVQFLEKRKLRPETVDKFLIGYAPGNHGFSRYLHTLPEKDRTSALAVATEVRLIGESKHGPGHYDFYRDRVMFPVHDHSGQVRGFSSRAVLPGDEPKYKNSTDSFVFKKEMILFGFNHAKNEIRREDKVLVAEGHMDVIMLHQFGFTWSVGCMGTAMSEHSVRLLSNMTKNVYLGLDADQAGHAAMVRINAMFMAHDIFPKYIDWSPAKDPDEFLNQFGQLELMARIEKAPTFVDKLIDGMLPKELPHNIDQKLMLLQQVFDAVSPLQEHLGATERVIDAAKRLGMRTDAASIVEDYRNFLKSKDRPAPPRPQAQEKLEEESPAVEQGEDQLEAHAHPLPQQIQRPMLAGEKGFLKMLLTHPECLIQPQIDEILAYVGHPEVKDLVQWLAKIYLEIDELEYVPILSSEVFSERYGREIQDVASEALLQHSSTKLNDKVMEKLLKDLQTTLSLEGLKQKRKENTELQKLATTQEEIDFYMHEIVKIDRELQQIKKAAP